MTVLWTSQTQRFHFCLSLCIISVLSQELMLEPASTAVLANSAVQFNATVQGPWTVMTWQVNGLLVLTVSLGSSDNVTSSSEQFSASFCSHSDNSCVEFTIQNVTRSQSGPVLCSVLGQFGSKTANLFVQESGTISIMTGETTVKQDQMVEFLCLTGGWYPEPTFGWSLDGISVNSSQYNTSSVADGDLFNSTSVLSFQAVSSTTVECWVTVTALNKPKSSSVSLVVVPEPPDWTVLIAMVVSIGGFALLILLIYGIIWCYRHRRGKQESNYQDEMMRRVRSQSHLSGSGQQDGKENAGYVPDGHAMTETPLSFDLLAGSGPSDHTDSGISQANSSNILEMSKAVNSNQPENQRISVYLNMEVSGFKHRHATTV